MKEHKHESLNKVKTQGKFFVIFAFIITFISMYYFSIEDYSFGLAIFTIAVTCWVLVIATGILIQARHTRQLIARINNIDEYYYCEQCHPESKQ